MKKVIVCGANGFIGKNLTKKLISDGYEVIAIGHSFSSELLNNKHIKTYYVNELDLIPHDDYECFYHFGWGGSYRVLSYGL